MTTQKQIIRIIKKVNDEKVLKDMLNLVACVYQHYINGKWEGSENSE